MAQGTIKWFNDDKGYGFITPDQGARDVFVHISAIRASGFEAVKEGERYEFELTQNQDGKTKATGLRLLTDASNG
ncbi:MAG: cold-shock protein [Pseudomonadota bacterium]